MALSGRTGIPYLRKVFFFTHLVGLVAGGIFPFVAAPLIGAQARSLPFVLSCMIMGFAVGACMFLFVRVTLKTQLRQHLELLRPLTGRLDQQGETVESLDHAVQSSVREVEDFVRSLLQTIDEFVPHYRSLASSSSYLSERARDGLNAALRTHQDVESMADKQQDIASRMALLSERTQDEASLGRELSSSLEEMAGAMEHSNAKFLETSASVDEMAASIREAAGQADQIARNTEGTVRDLDAIGEAFAKIREGAAGSAQVTVAVQEDAEQGLQVVQSSMEEMARIEAESRKAGEAMERLSRQTGEVSKIIEVIRELVSDTELLAFNAAIIAAKAGEEGKGFSVVADEIRDLADRTTASAQDIQNIVQAIGGDTREVTAAIEATSERIVRGRDLSRSTGDALHKIAAGVRQAASSSEDIVQLTTSQEEVARELLKGAGEGLRSIKAIARAIQEQQVAADRIQDGVGEMKAASDQVGRGMEEQVRANREFDRGLSAREEQIQAVSEAVSFQTEVAQRVFEHFSSSEKRLRSNAERASVLLQELEAMEALTDRLRELAETFQQQPAPADS